MRTLPPAITSRTNARVKALRASLNGEAAGAGDLLGVEGLHLIGELHKAGHSFETVYLRDDSESLLEQGWPSKLRAAQWAVLSRDVFDSAVTTATPQGLAATWIIREPTPPLEAPALTLVLENLQDPGNVGTLLRSAEAFGAGQVLLTPGSASQWSPKVVRASAGSVFRVPVVRGALPELLQGLRARGVRIFAAVGSFMGAHVLAAPHGAHTARQPDAAGGNGCPASLSMHTDFTPPCAILIGNEGAGLSDEARQLADEQVQIPCQTESLNAAVAGSVLLYEVQRQLPLRVWARQKGLRP